MKYITPIDTLTDLILQSNHTLKCDSVPFNELVKGYKRSEIRKNDRNYKLSDKLRLREIVCEEYSGRELGLIIKHIQTGYGLMEGYVCLSVEIIWTLHW